MFKRLAKSLDCQEFITHLPALRLFFYPVTNKSLVNIAFNFFLKKVKVVWIVLTGRWDLMGWPLWRHCGGGELLDSDCCSRLEPPSFSDPPEAQPSNTRAQPVPWHAKNGSKRRQKGAKNGLKRDPVLLSIYDSWYTKTAHLLLFQFLMKWLTYWGQWYWQCFGMKYEKWKTF